MTNNSTAFFARDLQQLLFVSRKNIFIVSSVVRIIKTNTDKAMRECFPFLDKVYWGVEGIWLIRYFVSTVGISGKGIQKYIEMQVKEDSRQAQLEL